MWKIELKPELLISVNYEDIRLPLSVRAFNPILFKEGDMVYCLLGPPSSQGIYGYGPTAEDALYSWDKEFQKRIRARDKKDTTARFVVGKIMAIRRHTCQE